MTIIGMDTDALLALYDEINRWLTDARTGADVLERDSQELPDYWRDDQADRVVEGLKGSVKNLQGLLDRLEELNHRMWREMDEWLMADGMGERSLRELKGGSILGKPPEPAPPRETELAYYASEEEDDGGGFWSKVGGAIKSVTVDPVVKISKATVGAVDKYIIEPIDEYVIDPIADGITGIFTPTSAAPAELKGKLPEGGIVGFQSGILNRDDAIPSNILNRDDAIPSNILNRDDAIPSNILNRDDAIPSNILNRDDAIPSNILNRDDALPSSAIPSNLFSPISPADLSR